MKEYKKEIIVLSVCLVISIISFAYIKNRFFSSESLDAPVKKVVSNIKDEREVNYSNEVKYKQATVAPTSSTTTTKVVTTSIQTTSMDELLANNDEIVTSYPYEVAPSFEDDGSIIYDGMTITELTDKLNRSLGDYLTNTGYFFAEYTKRTGLDPYLSVAIVLLETGCKWSCSNQTKTCNNIGGLKGGPSCNGTSYKKFNNLGEGIDGFLDIIYNKYYLKGMTTAESMASTYAASSEWANKVNTYIEEIKAR